MMPSEGEATNLHEVHHVEVQSLMIVQAHELDAQQTYKLLTGVVVPRPIAWITTQSAAGVLNLAPFSAFTFVSTKPPLLGVNIGRKAGVRKDTAVNILSEREFVVHIAHGPLVEPLHASAVEHPPEVSEVELLQLQTAPGSHVRVPRLQAAPVALVCRLHSVTPYGDTGSEFFVGEVLCWHVREGLLVQGKVDSFELDPLCRLGGPWYATLGQRLHQTPHAQTPKTVLTRDG
jgi:flavin reductase (DIM6/NTAB) family NADH-FMN oxidoreductase RutF